MSLDKTLLGVAKSAIDKQQKTRDGRNVVSKGVDAVTNKSYANEDKKIAAAALRQWENSTWKPKVATKLKQELKTRAPHLKPGTKAYQDTYDSLYNKNYQDLQSAKAKAQQQLGTLRQKGQTQRQLDNDYSQKEAARNKNTKLQSASLAARDTAEAVSGALATGTSRALRYPLQLAADVGENDDGGIFDRGAKALERHEDNLQQVYPAYEDIQQNGNFGQKLALSAVEQVPNLALSFTGAGAASKGAQLLGAGSKVTAATAYGTAAATMYPQAYGDGNDSTKQELENATPEQLATAVRSKDIYKSHFDKNVKAGMSEDEAHAKSRDQTISSIAEESGDAVGLATLALSMLAPGVGSFTANRAAGGAVSKWGQKVFNTLAVKADAGKVAKVAIPAAVGAGIVGLNIAEEGLQEGFTDYTAQSAAVDVGVKDKIDTAQTKEAVLMGGILGGLMGGSAYVGTRNSKLHQAQDDLKTAQQAYAEVAGQIPQLQQQIEAVSPRSAEGQALTARVEETRAALDAMAAEAEKASIPRTSLARRAPRIEPTNSTANDFDGGIDGATEMDAESFENTLNPDGTPAPQATPAAPIMSEQELDAQDAQIAELIAEQQLLDDAIEDGSSEKPLEESIAAAQSWYDSKRGEGKQGLAGVVSRAAATEQDTAFAQQQEVIKGATTSINDYIASERAKQQQADAQLQQDAVAAKTEREKKEVELRAKQREIDRAQEDELLATREQLAQPYENELFDTTIVGADGAPFKLARFWDSNMPAAAKAKAIADAFGGQVDQNVAKSDWANLPEGVQKDLHKWFTERLDGVRQSREGAAAPITEQVTAPIAEQPQEVAPTASGLTMPVRAEKAPVEAEQGAASYTLDNLKGDISNNYGSDPQAMLDAQNLAKEAGLPQAEINRVIQETISEKVGWTKPAATQLTDENPVINIPAPTQAKAEEAPTTTDEGIYKSQPAARAAMKKQKLDPKTTDIVQTDEGWGFVEKPADSTAPNNDVAIGKDGQAKWFGSNDKAQAFISKKGLSDTHEVVSAGKSRFEIQPKAESTPQADVEKAETVSEIDSRQQPSKPKNITDEQFAELTSSRTTPSTPTGEQSAPAKRAAAKKAATEKSQNDVAAETKDRFADNKLFTEDKVAAARALLKSKMGQVNSGFDPEMAIAGMTLAGAYIESGVRKFGDYAKLMVEDFGDNIKPQLLSFWEGARNWDGLDTEGMTSVADSKREYNQLKAEIITTEELSENNNDTGTSNQDDKQRADGELSTADQADAEGRNAGRVQTKSTSDVSDIDGRSNRSDTNDGDEAGQSAGKNKRAASTDSGSRTGSTQSNDGANAKSNKSAAVKATDYAIPPRDENAKQPSWFEIGERNVEIIELVQQLESEGRHATPDEQALLADYKGWGSSKIEVFPHPTKGYSSPRWEALGEKLKSLLTDSEYATARRTTQYAHYTPPSIVNGIYAALEQFGFKGGQVFEPASGIGVFNGLMPRDMASKSHYVGVELDPMTALIAKHLYPLSDMSMGDYTKVKLPDNHFDVAVGNPPFADISYNYGAGKNKKPYLIHDYFFAKTLDKLKPGGVMAFVTSKGSMDKTNSAARDSFAEQADLIGAIRLPNTAFKDEAGTAVVTDIIFLRKRLEGEVSNGVKWTDSKEQTIDGEKISINEYFIDNPNMVLGRNAITSGQFGPTYTVETDSNNLAGQIETAVAQLPKDIFSPARGSNAEAAKVAEIDYGVKSSQQREGGVYVKDGKLMKVIDGVGKPLTHRYGTNGKRIELTDAQIKFLTDYTGVRDAFKQSQQDQLNDNPNWQDSLDNLNTAYDSFVKKHGRLMAHTISTTERADGKEITTTRFANKAILFLDVDGYVASALENIVDGEVVGKNAVIEKGSYFKGRTLNKPKTPTIKTTQDALVYVLNEVGTPNIKQIAKLVNKSEQEVIADLGSQVFTNPETGSVEMAEIYLSGNVVEKLATAEAMAAKDSQYKKNVNALKDVQPNFIAPNDISSNLGSGWIPGEVIKQFSQEVLDASITANYSGAAGLWDVSGYSRNSDYQTPDKTTKELMDAILNSRPITVTYTVDGKSYTNAEKTELAEQMASKIQKAFKDWIWKDTERANTLAEYYNKNYNNIVPPTFNGDHLTLAGMSSKIQLRPHQKTGIYRVVSQGDVYLNHAVGAGKTFTMIAAAMEEKRLGLINKPMFVVPNHMLAQFSQEFLMLYPAADIVVADEQNFHTHNRKQFVAEISVNNPDAIIITHTAFGKIGVKPETQQKFLESTLNDWREALLSAKSMKGEDNSQSVRQLERNIQTMETKLTDLLKAEAKDDTTFFEDMGVDKLIVDEMHEYRKLSYATRQGRIKGITSSGSQMASDLQMKIELIREKNPTRAIVGASGTPVTNTMGELFSVQSYFQPKQLRKDGLHHFDNWANQFGEVVKGLEQNAAGNYEVVPRFAKFLNVPELMSRVRWFMDVLTSDQLGDVVQRPDIVGGGRQIISVPAPDGFDEFQQGLADRITATRNRSGKPKKGDDNILKIINDGRFGAIDLRFVNPDLPSDPNSKLNRAIADMAKAYHDTANNEYHDGKGNVDELTGGAQMLFTNIGLGAQSAASTGFDMKAWINTELIRLGVEPDHIAFMADANSHAKKGKLFEDMRQGRKRILIGGSNMETGVNAQKRLTHLAHLDSPWFPATVEQREGRIIRQGNQNKEVVIRAYATKGSYDSTMWGMVARKARFIQQAMNGDVSMRHMDDISEASAFEQASALSSGDPRALQLAGLAADVERLDRYYSAYENARIENSREAKRSKESVTRAERELSKVTALLDNHKKIETGGVIGKVGSKTFDNRQEFGEAIIKAFDKLKATQSQGEHVLGTASGYNVVYNGVMLGETFIADADISIPKSNDNVLFDNNSGEVSASGIATSIINRVNGLIDYKTAIEKKIEGFKKDAENFERRASQNFENETERREKHAEYKELDDSLRAEAAALKAQASGSNSPTPLTDADRVPAKDEQPKFSKTNPAKGVTGTTSQQIIGALQKRFGKEAVASLVKSGKLRVRSLNDFVNADGRLLIPSDAEGFYYDGKVTLIADNLTPETVVATLLHELGGHAGIQSMLAPQTYMSLMENFYALVRSGNKYAVRAKSRAEAMTGSDSEARDEYIPYLITEYAQATERGGPLVVIKRFVNRVMAGVRAWVRKHTGVQLKMTPNDMVQLAERMVKRLAEQSMDSMTIADVENMPAAQMQFSQDSVQQANTPAFREWFDANNPDTRYSRRYSSLGTDGKPVTAKEKARDRVALAQAVTMSSKFGINLLLRRHLATPQHVALLNPVFKIFTDNVQARIAYENNEAGLIQTYLPEIWDTRLIVGKKKESMERVSKAIFDGTMADKVWSDSELQTMFNLNDQDIGFYRRARQAVDGSVLNMTVDTLSSLAKGTKLVNIETIHRLKLQGLHPIFHNLALQKHMTDELEKLAKGGLITPKAEARLQKQLDAVFDVMGAIAGKYDKLVEDGYAPLMRFGHYAVEVRDKTDNKLDLFELYETKGQQRKAIKELKERYDTNQFTVDEGTLNPEGFKQFKNKGLSPETVQLFAAELGLDDDGAYQAYLKIAVSDRSALKRLIHRKKVPGYSEDMPRVLSAFVMSNARYSGRGLYNNEIERSIQNIEDGNLQNEAQKVFENMENPQEEFAGTRSLMFFYFMGFSPAFFFLNLTQPFTQTIPKLTAYVGAAKGHAYMAQAMAIIGKHMGQSIVKTGKKLAGLPSPNFKGFEDKLPAWVKREDYLRMAREGHLDPQNIYMIKGLERGKAGVASGVWGNIEAAAGWFAEVSESINRRSTMIAAFRVAKDMGDAKLKAKGFDSEYDFAVSVIQQTQGIYNKGNRSGLARGNGKLGQYGPLILVFKQFTINYTEQMIRHGKDKEAGALVVAMMWQFGLAGMLGLPFADDLRDIFEGLAYRLFGKAFNLPDYLEGLLGKSNADALMYGYASEKWRVDLHGRSSLGNIIPGTDVVRPGPTDWAEILGASSGFYESFFSAAALAADGHYKDAVITASPRFVRDAASGAEIAITGSYRNTKGDKIMDLDRTDAVIKTLQFNPANNAKPGRDRSNAYNMKNMLKAKTDYFSKHLAEAMYQENDDRVDELYNEMDEWNDKNAEHFNVDIEKIEKSAEKRVTRKDFGSEERQNVQESLALRQQDLAGT